MEISIKKDGSGKARTHEEFEKAIETKPGTTERPPTPEPKPKKKA